MIIKFTDFSEGVHEISLSETSEYLQLSSEFFGNVDLNCKMDKSSHQIVLSCNAVAGAHFMCDRCNSEYDAPVNFNFQTIYMFSKEYISDDDAQENVHFLSPEKTTIDLSGDVREFALLSLPMKKLCSEDCKGLCSKCGKNLNEGQCDCVTDEINPVWEPLQKLKNKLNN